MIESYFIPAERLIMNILTAKAEIRRERIAKVSTDPREIMNICKYISQEINPDQIVFESSSKDILATIQQCPYRFVQNEQTKKISLSPSYHTKNRKKLEEIYAISPKLTKCFKNFFKEKMRKEQQDFLKLRGIPAEEYDRNYGNKQPS